MESVSQSVSQSTLCGYGLMGTDKHCPPRGRSLVGFGRLMPFFRSPQPIQLPRRRPAQHLSTPDPDKQLGCGGLLLLSPPRPKTSRILKNRRSVKMRVRRICAYSECVLIINSTVKYRRIGVLDFNESELLGRRGLPNCAYSSAEYNILSQELQSCCRYR